MTMMDDAPTRAQEQAWTGTGVMSRHPKGFGFCKLEAPHEGHEVFVPASGWLGALPGDRVTVTVQPGREGRLQGEVTAVLSRHCPEVVGRFRPTTHGGFVQPLDPSWPDVYVPHEEGSLGVAAGTLVTCRLTARSAERSAQARMTHVWSRDWDRTTVAAAALQRQGLPVAFSSDALAQSAALPTTVPADDPGRWDLRGVPFMTIDGADSRDFDDAVWAMPDEGGWRLMVAIADVSAYVAEGSALDVDAAHRATSVYLPGQVVPMLPEALSNGLCSLNPGVDRWALVCDCRVSHEGELGPSLFYPALIHSQARLTYDQASAILAGLERAPSASVGQALRALNALSQVRAAARQRQGALSFESAEWRVLFHGERVSGLRQTERCRAHGLIEECMLSANVLAAEFLLAHTEGVYRVHGAPDALRVRDAQAYLDAQAPGVTLPDAPTAKDIAQLLTETATHPEAGTIAALLRRLPGKAVYEADNRGHFGLGLSAYTHFTSPIRRYSDVLVHRAIKAVLTGAPAQARVALMKQAEQCNARERAAISAERECVERHQCVWLAEQTGHVVPGTLEGATAHGLFVALDGSGARGRVSAATLTALGAQWQPSAWAWVSPTQQWRLGQRLLVRIQAVQPDALRVELALA